MNLGLLRFDVQSFKRIMMDDLAQAWRGGTLKPLDITFREYVMAEQARRQTAAWHDAREYWQEKLPQFTLSAELPIGGERRRKLHLHHVHLNDRRSLRQAVKQRWQQQGLTFCPRAHASTAAASRRWSRTHEFTLNLTFFNRQPVRPQISQLIGDFTSVTLVDFNFTAPATLQEQMQRTQQRLWQNGAQRNERRR